MLLLFIKKIQAKSFTKAKKQKTKKAYQRFSALLCFIKKIQCKSFTKTEKWKTKKHTNASPLY